MEVPLYLSPLPLFLRTPWQSVAKGEGGRRSGRLSLSFSPFFGVDLAAEKRIHTRQKKSWDTQNQNFKFHLNVTHVWWAKGFLTFFWQREKKSRKRSEREEEKTLLLLPLLPLDVYTCLTFSWGGRGRGGGVSVQSSKRGGSQKAKSGSSSWGWKREREDWKRARWKRPWEERRESGEKREEGGGEEEDCVRRQDREEEEEEGRKKKRTSLESSSEGRTHTYPSFLYRKQNNI